MEERILECAIKNFLELGIKSVTMDVIARELGVSKKTIYTFFRNKNELISKCVDVGLKWDYDMFFSEHPEDFMEHFIATNKIMFKVFETISPVFFFELSRLYPIEFEKMETYKYEKVLNHLIEIYEKGKQQGYVREDLEIEIVLIMRMEQISGVFASKNYKRRGCSFVKVQKVLGDHFMKSVLTPEGLVKYKRLMNK